MGENTRIEAVAVGSWTRRVRIVSGEHLFAETSKDVVKALEPLDAYAGASATLIDDIRGCEGEIARERALLLLGCRERTRFELETRLAGEGYSHECVAELLDGLERVGALSDERYAEIFARSKLAAGWSRRRVESRMREDGVPQELAHTTLEELTDDDADADRAYRLIAGLDLDGPKARSRALGRLARRGYTPSQAYAALDRARRGDAGAR